MGTRVATKQDHIRYKIAKLHVEIAARSLRPLCAKPTAQRLHRKQSRPRWEVYPVNSKNGFNDHSGYINGVRWTAINVGARTEEEALAKGGPLVYSWNAIR